MKELTTEQKAKAYDRVSKEVRDFFEGRQKMYSDVNQTLEYLFPEIKEKTSEGERIRKNLIEFLDSVWHLGKDANFDKWGKTDCSDWIAWLEKQEGCELIKKDWLEHIKQSWYKEGFIDGKYSDGTSKEWTINDAATFKELIDFLENGTAKLQHDLTRYANWLKIQFTPIEKQDVQNPTNDVVPKFKVGDWVVDKNGTVQQILSYKNGIYKHTNGYSSKMFEDEWRLWDITKDAKDGDVLSDGTTVFIFKDSLSDGSVMSYCDYDTDSGEGDAFCPLSMNLMCSKITPTTKSQRDALFAKMKDAGYEWNAEKKELKKINSYCQEHCKGYQETGKCFADGDCKDKREAEQKSAWSEEDKRIIRRIDCLLYSINESDFEDIHAWLKSLKDRVQPKQKWNEEDNEWIESLMQTFEGGYLEGFNQLESYGVIDWLKTLKQRI